MYSEGPHSQASVLILEHTVTSEREAPGPDRRRGGLITHAMQPATFYRLEMRARASCHLAIFARLRHPAMTQRRPPDPQ